MKSKDQAILVTCYIKESSNLTGEKNLRGSKLKNQTVQLFKMTESIYCFYGCLNIGKKLIS